MVSKKELAKNIKDINDKLAQFTPNSTIQMEAKLEAKKAAIDSQVAALNVYGKSIYYHEWIILNQWADYMANIFKYESKDFKHTFFINRVIRYAFLFGYCWVWNDNGTPRLCTVQFEGNQWYAYEIPDTIDTEEKGEGFYTIHTVKYKKFKTPVKLENLIKYQYSSLGYSAYITLRPIVKMEQIVSRALYNEVLMLPTRVINSSDSPNANSSAARQLLDFNSSILFKFADGTDRFEPLELANASTEMIATIEYAKNYYYDILGRRSNTEYKRAHALEAELEAGQRNIEILERDRWLHLKNFLVKYSKLFNTQLYLQTSAGDYEDVNKLDILIREEHNETDRDNRDGLED